MKDISKKMSTENLEKELEQEKVRFLDASKRAASAIQRDLKIGNWFRQYPMESAMAIIGIGFFAGYVIQQKRSFSHGKYSGKHGPISPPTSR